jgi:hypothetical protein
MIVGVERPINCDQPECPCDACQILSPDGTDAIGPYREFYCGLFTWILIYID